MQGRIFAGIVLVLLLAGGGVVAQSTSRRETPVWTMEFIKVKPGMFGLALGQLDANWMRVREEAKHQGAVLIYYRIAEPAGSQSDGNIVLLTEYKNQATCDTREVLFESIRRQLTNEDASSGVLRHQKDSDIFDTLSTRVFQDYSDIDSAQFRLLVAN